MISGPTIQSDRQNERILALPLVIDTDFTGAKRDTAPPTPGPFRNTGPGERKIKVP